MTEWQKGDKVRVVKGKFKAFGVPNEGRVGTVVANVGDAVYPWHVSFGGRESYFYADDELESIKKVIKESVEEKNFKAGDRVVTQWGTQYDYVKESNIFANTSVVRNDVGGLRTFYTEDLLPVELDFAPGDSVKSKLSGYVYYLDDIKGTEALLSTVEGKPVKLDIKHLEKVVEKKMKEPEYVDGAVRRIQEAIESLTAKPEKLSFTPLLDLMTKMPVLPKVSDTMDLFGTLDPKKALEATGLGEDDVNALLGLAEALGKSLKAETQAEAVKEEPEPAVTSWTEQIRRQTGAQEAVAKAAKIVEEIEKFPVGTRVRHTETGVEYNIIAPPVDSKALGERLDSGKVRKLETRVLEVVRKAPEAVGASERGVLVRTVKEARRLRAGTRLVTSQGEKTIRTATRKMPNRDTWTLTFEGGGTTTFAGDQLVVVSEHRIVD